VRGGTPESALAKVTADGPPRTPGEAGVCGFWALGFAFARAFERVAGGAPRGAVDVSPGL
jgi:hypothetical protein